MARYANVIVDISHEKLDKTFQYAIPEERLEVFRWNPSLLLWRDGLKEIMVQL